MGISVTYQGTTFQNQKRTENKIPFLRNSARGRTPLLSVSSPRYVVLLRVPTSNMVSLSSTSPTSVCDDLAHLSFSLFLHNLRLHLNATTLCGKLGAKFSDSRSSKQVERKHSQRYTHKKKKEKQEKRKRNKETGPFSRSFTELLKHNEREGGELEERRRTRQPTRNAGNQRKAETTQNGTDDVSRLRFLSFRRTRTTQSGRRREKKKGRTKIGVKGRRSRETKECR